MPHFPGSTLTDADRVEVQTALAEFDRNWHAQKLAEVLPKVLPPGHRLRREIVLGLVRIDMLRQWQAGRRLSVEEYLAVCPELGTPDDPPLELIQSEVDARRQVSAPTDLTEFLRRFPTQTERLRSALELTLQGAASQPAQAAETVDTPGLGPGIGRVPGIGYRLPCKFGRYKLLRVLGRGGMGAVYLAHDTQLDREVALKIPLIAPTDGADVLPRFYREARAAATLHHANICPVYDVGEIDGTPYMTMAFIEGKSLSDVIKGKKQLPQREAAQLIRRVALAMHEAHKKGVVHRDLKPSNIHMTPAGEPVIMDFGIARRTNKEGERLTRTGQLIGTPEFMAPEQARGDLVATGPQSDIFSLGVILYRLLAGQVPFEGQLVDLLIKLTTEDPRPPSQVRPDLDPRLESACLKAMARKPEDRFASMTDFAAALDVYLADALPEVSPRAPTAGDDAPVPMEANSLPAGTLPPASVPGQPPAHARARPRNSQTAITAPLTAPPPAPSGQGAKVAVMLFIAVGIAGAGGYWLLNQPRPTPPGTFTKSTGPGVQPETHPDATKPKGDKLPTPLEQAQEALQKKDYDRAITLCTEVLKIEPKNELAWRRRGLAFLALDNPAQAVKDLTAALDLDPRDAAALAGRAKANLQLKQHEAAITDALAAVAINPSLPLDAVLLPAYTARGLQHLQNRAYPQAVAAFTEAIDLSPKDAALRKHRGEAQAGLRVFDAAAHDFCQALELDPEDVRSWSQYLHALLGRGDLATYRAKCKEMYARPAKSEDPSNLNLSAWLGALVPGAVDDPRAPVQRAETTWKKSNEKTDIFYRNTLAAALYRAGDAEKAARHLEAIGKLREERKDQRGNVNDWIFLGLAYYRLADPKAREWLDRAIRGIDQESALPGCTWNRRVELEFLRKEVEGLLKKVKG
jgi:tetratricopeptide (TPR) repeat protein/predicted Ser/Thr protein kinase